MESEQTTPGSATTVASDAHWLNARRLMIYPRMALFVFGFAAAVLVFEFEGLTDAAGAPLGGDFGSHWAASLLALNGDSLGVFETGRLEEALRFVLPVAEGQLMPWASPPMFLVVVWPLALLPYVTSYLWWVISTFALFAAVVQRLAPSPQTFVLALAFPAVFINATSGQSGFLTAALFGGAVLLLDSRPIGAGVLVGLLAFKPCLGLLFPFALACGRRWKALSAAAVTALCFVGMSTAAFGFEYWELLAESLLRSGAVGRDDPEWWQKMATFFSTFRLLGIESTIAGLLHGAVALWVVTTVCSEWWRGAPLRVAASLLITGSLLVAPRLFGYDLPILGVAIALLAWDGRSGGWLRWEREVLVVAWLTPLVGALVVQFVPLQLAPLGLLALFLVSVRRAREFSSARPALVEVGG